MGPGCSAQAPSLPFPHAPPPTLQEEARGSCSKGGLEQQALDPGSDSGQCKKQCRAETPGHLQGHNSTAAPTPLTACQNSALGAVAGNAAANSQLQGDSVPLLSTGTAGSDGRQQAAVALQDLPPPAADQSFLKPAQLSNAQRMLVQLSCTSEPVLEQLVAAMQPSQRERFRSEMAAVGLGTEGTRQRVQRTYSLLRQVAGMCPEGDANTALKQHVKTKCQQLTRQQEEELALCAQQLPPGS